MSGISHLLSLAEAKEPINREAVACLLPAAIAYLQQLSKATVPEHNAPPATESASLAAAMPASMQARTISDGKNKAAEGHGDVVRAFFVEQVMQYMTVKPKAAQGMVLEAVQFSILRPYDVSFALCNNLWTCEISGKWCSATYSAELYVRSTMPVCTFAYTCIHILATCMLTLKHTYAS